VLLNIDQKHYFYIEYNQITGIGKCFTYIMLGLQILYLLSVGDNFSFELAEVQPSND